MEIFKIKRGTTFETLDNTLLVAIEIGNGYVVFFEFAYNTRTSEYDILINKYRSLTQEEIKVELYRSYRKNYKVVLDK